MVSLVPNIAHDSPAPLSVTANPAFWNGAPLNVPANSTARPEPTSGSVRNHEPSTDAVPLGNVVAPPVQLPIDQPAGTPVPSNSAPTSGASWTSPPAEFATYVPTPGVPAPNCDAEVSVAAAVGVVKDTTGAPVAGHRPVLPNASVATTR